MIFRLCNLDACMHLHMATTAIGKQTSIVNNVKFKLMDTEDTTFNNPKSVLNIDEYNSKTIEIYKNVQNESSNFNFGFLIFDDIVLYGMHYIILDFKERICYIGDSVGWSLEFLKWHTETAYKANWNYDNTEFEIDIPHSRINFETALTLNFPGSYIYGHWLLDQIPRLFLMSTWKLLENSSFITAHLPEFCDLFLSLFGINRSHFVFTEEHIPIYIEKLQIPTFPHAGARMPHKFLRRAWQTANQEFVRTLPEANYTIADQQKIFVSRRNWPYTARKLPINNDELEKLVSSRGYKIFSPETMPIDQQIKIFASAKIIVGLDGSGLHNIMFSGNASTLGVIDWASRRNLWHIAFCESLGHKVAFIDSSFDENGNQFIDLRIFSRFLDQIETKLLTPQINGLVKHREKEDSFVEEDDLALDRDNVPRISKPPTSVPDLAGELYFSVLARLHDLIRPKRYLEVGTRYGDSLRLAKCNSIAIDPSFELQGEFLGEKKECYLYKMTSDEFFRQFQPDAILRGPVDLAFLDGLHLFEVLLRDFLNLERHCSRNSVVVLHDCIPTDAYICVRDENDMVTRNLGTRPQWWAGDVWKLIPILRKFRPDLRIYCYDAIPTGLVIITNLNNNSTVLQENYFDIVEEFMPKNLATEGIEGFFSNLNLRSTSDFLLSDEVSKLFWL